MIRVVTGSAVPAVLGESDGIALPVANTCKGSTWICNRSPLCLPQHLCFTMRVREGKIGQLEGQTTETRDFFFLRAQARGNHSKGVRGRGEPHRGKSSSLPLTDLCF